MVGMPASPHLAWGANIFVPHGMNKACTLGDTITVTRDSHVCMYMTRIIPLVSNKD